LDKYLQRLDAIYREIDSLYEIAQRHYEFHCKGCPEYCCSTKFYHHTLLEEFSLAEGSKKLDETKKKEIRSWAKAVFKVHRTSREAGREMCPLNKNSLCVLYQNHPLICRLHRLPYELYKRDMSIEYVIGCYRFMAEKLTEAIQYLPFNRTIFYTEIAKPGKNSDAKLISRADLKELPRR